MKKNSVFVYIGIFIVAFLLLSKYDVQMISGNSMNPTFDNGDLILVDKTATPEDLDVIIIGVNGDERFSNDSIIKRYYEEYSSDGLYVIGDNVNDSLDSRIVGEFDKSSCDGVVIYNISKGFRSVVATITGIFN